ncbi:hypothetical protein [Aliikangiella coralliicola]|uniref:Uncharacterized protein n=1 Tax=Aliikangiella coralliicola TaxID=2592383 RepID=A0A545UGK4_9GAMM|nr:hypothetical protein [Aliikangiella coralliicola]TQV88598.1 hypothetical protein FLL46_08770 [Aliikangiella coralliicola]
MLKVLNKITRYLLLLAFVAYLLFLWQVKNDINEFLRSRPLNLEIDYSWLWVDWQGKIFLQNAVGYADSDVPIWHSALVQVDFGSLTDIWKMKEYVVFRNLPPNLKILIVEAHTTKALDLKAFFQTSTIKILTSLVPVECQNNFYQHPAPFRFSLLSELKYQETSSQIEFDVDLKMLGLMNAVFTGNIDNFNTSSTNNPFVSSLTFSSDRHTLLQQRIQKCIEDSALPPERVVKRFSEQLNRFASERNYSLTREFTDIFENFVFSPQSFHVSYHPPVGLNWNQLMQMPVHELPDKAGVTLELNAKNTNHYFSNLAQRTQIQKEPSNASTKQENNSFLPVSYSGLQNFEGSKVILHLTNNGTVTGIIDRLKINRLELAQHQFGGKSILPFKYSEISSIELVNNH